MGVRLRATEGLFDPGVRCPRVATSDAVELVPLTLDECHQLIECGRLDTTLRLS
jgi:hypothetical protein